MFEVKRVIVGQDRMVERMFVALLARGHCLLEGVPGIAKSLAVETLARVVGGFTVRPPLPPHHVPSEILGIRLYLPPPAAVRGRVWTGFTNPVVCRPGNRRPP